MAEEDQEEEGEGEDHEGLIPREHGIVPMAEVGREATGDPGALCDETLYREGWLGKQDPLLRSMGVEGADEEGALFSESSFAVNSIDFNMLSRTLGGVVVVVAPHSSPPKGETAVEE